jgi:hypothetical protein
MKLVTSLTELTPLDMDEPMVGSLVKLSADPTSTGMIIQFLSEKDVVVLWSSPPPLLRKRYGEIW